MVGSSVTRSGGAWCSKTPQDSNTDSNRGSTNQDDHVRHPLHQLIDAAGAAVSSALDIWGVDGGHALWTHAPTPDECLLWWGGTPCQVGVQVPHIRHGKRGFAPGVRCKTSVPQVFCATPCPTKSAGSSQ